MSAHTSDSRPPQDGASGAAESASVAGVLVVLLSTAFVMMLNETTVAVALPAIMGEFHVSAATAQWLLTGFMLTMAVVMPTTGWMLERFSTRAVFIVAVAAFLLGTLLAALAPWFGVLLLGRLFQGAGTAVVLPLMMAVTMMTLVAAERRGTAMGLIAVVMAVGPALGPTVAGAVLSAASWHAIFWVMLPLVAASGLLGLARLRNVGTPRRLPLDVVSVVLSVLAFGGLIYGLSSIGQILAGGSAAVVALSVTGVGAVALVLFALRQIRRARTGEVLSAFLTSAGLVGIALVLSLFIRAPRSGSRTEIEG
ncbi:MFS transporter [Kocuria palustris]|uniref:MFS transporter n=1 Tax=Kocuria palustris TaxID=71999 RepID=UPI0035E10220